MNAQQPGESVPHLCAGHHRVHKAVLHLKFRSLKALRQRLADRLLRPANPMSAPGSARMMSPKDAKLAVTPPVVGSVRTERYTRPVRANRSSAALVLAICMRDRIPSCIRAPPLAQKKISGSFALAAYSTARVSFSPTAALMLPIKKRLSITPTTQRTPPIAPTAVTAASPSPVFRWAFSNFSR